jgi:hypothetical protein
MERGVWRSLPGPVNVRMGSAQAKERPSSSAECVKLSAVGGTRFSGLFLVGFVGANWGDRLLAG